MQTAVNVAGVLGGFGTLIVAWLVYQFGRQQAAQNDARAERQLFLGDLDAVTDKLMLLARISARQEQARSDDETYDKLLEKQFKLEDELWPVLTPLVEMMRAATRVRERAWRHVEDRGGRRGRIAAG
jgi:hypothetical protein